MSNILEQSTIDKLILGRNIMDNFHIAHDLLYKQDYSKDELAEEHRKLETKLHQDIIDLGFLSVNDFAIYNDVYKLIEDNREIDAQQLLNDYLNQNG